jgi:hypothetical protein
MGLPAEAIFYPPTFMDDLGIPIEASCAEELVCKTEVAASLVCSLASSYGLSVNFGAGKTEAVLLLAGRSAVATRAALRATGRLALCDCLAIDLTGGGVLRVVSCYKHLGGHVSAMPSLRKEVAYRVKEAGQATGQLARRFLCRSALTTESRTMVVGACVHSRLFHLAGTWPVMSRTMGNRIAGCYMRPLRMVAGAHCPPTADAARASNYAVLLHVGVAPAAWALIAARLRMAAKMLRGSVPVALALALAQGGSGWFHLVLLSARAVWRLLRGKLSELPDPLVDPAVWVDYWRNSAGGWAAQVKLALRTAACETDEALAALDGMPEIALGCPSPADEEDADDSEVDDFLCGVAGCHKTFSSIRAVLAHRAGAHGISKNAEYKKRIRDGRCPVCNRDFEVRLRCLHHVVHCSAACKEAILGGGYPELCAAQLAAADAEDLEHRRRCRASGRHELHALVPGR